MRGRKIKPTVQAPGKRGHSRTGKGFSLREIRDAGLTVTKVKSLDIPVDKRRKTLHAENLRLLRMEYAVSTPLTEIKGIGKSAEEKLIGAEIFDCLDLAEADLDELSARLKYPRSRLEIWQTAAKKVVKKKPKN